MSGSQRTVLIQKGEGIADKIVTGFLCTIPEMKEKLEGGNIMINLGTLKEITDLRSIWPHEALNFTPWVAENVELLADAVGLDITVDETESSVGNFNVDIYASETGTDRKIIIENQLEDTDHDHLGKLITYASGKDADVVIWVVKHAREEHKAAVEWLNNHTDDKIGFFLCEIKLFQIGDSDIAPSFTVVERPNDWTKEIKKTTLTNQTQQQRLEYWNAFNDYAFQNTEFAKSFNKRKPNTDHWMDFSIGSSACNISVTQIQKRNKVGVELYTMMIKNSLKVFIHIKTRWSLLWDLHLIGENCRRGRRVVLSWKKM